MGATNKNMSRKANNLSLITDYLKHNDHTRGKHIAEKLSINESSVATLLTNLKKEGKACFEIEGNLRFWSWGCKFCGTCKTHRPFNRFQDTRKTCIPCREKYKTKSKTEFIRGIDYEQIEPVITLDIMASRMRGEL